MIYIILIHLFDKLICKLMTESNLLSSSDSIIL